MRIFLVRHGDVGKFVSCPKDELTRQGINEMELLGHRFRADNNISSERLVIIHGNHPRVEQSALMFALAAYPGDLPRMEHTAKLDDKDYGEKFYNMKDSKEKEMLAGSSWIFEYEEKFLSKFNSETNEEVYNRLKEVYDYIKTYNKSKDIVILSSGVTLATIDLIVQGLSFEDMKKLTAEEYKSVMINRGEIKEIFPEVKAGV